MNLSVIEKIGTIIKYIFSSYLSIEMFIITALTFTILTINVKRKNRLISLIAIGIYLGFVLGILISYTTYVQTAINSFTKEIMNYIYFPSTICYFFIMIFVTGMMIYTLFSKKMKSGKKIMNYLTFSILYFFFTSFISLASYYEIDLVDMTELYKNDIILSIVQVSNIILVLWTISTGFYHLYLYYKKKFDKE